MYLELVSLKETQCGLKIVWHFSTLRAQVWFCEITYDITGEEAWGTYAHILHFK